MTSSTAGPVTAPAPSSVDGDTAELAVVADDVLLKAATVVGAATAASGVMLMLAPRPVMWLLGTGRGQPAPFLFRVIGMFMTVSGASMVDACRAPEPSPNALGWAFVSKVGAAAMVTVGVRRHRMGPLAWVLAVFDGGAAALLAVIMRRR